jgi:hypothetical protein
VRTSLLAALLCAPVVLGPVYACTAREVAKDEYSAQSHACVQIYSGDVPAQRACLEYVRKKWDAAGARPAAADGGAQ